MEQLSIQSWGFLIGFHIKIIIIIIVIVIVTLTCPDACCESGQTSGSCCIFRPLSWPSRTVLVLQAQVTPLEAPSGLVWKCLPCWKYLGCSWFFMVFRKKWWTLFFGNSINVQTLVERSYETKTWPLFVAGWCGQTPPWFFWHVFWPEVHWFYEPDKVPDSQGQQNHRFGANNWTIMRISSTIWWFQIMLLKFNSGMMSHDEPSDFVFFRWVAHPPAIDCNWFKMRG